MSRLSKHDYATMTASMDTVDVHFPPLITTRRIDGYQETTSVLWDFAWYKLKRMCKLLILLI